MSGHHDENGDVVVIAREDDRMGCSVRTTVVSEYGTPGAASISPPDLVHAPRTTTY